MRLWAAGVAMNCPPSWRAVKSLPRSRRRGAGWKPGESGRGRRAPAPSRAEAERQHTGTRRRGKAPTPVQETPDDKAQTNFTDPELQIMRTNNKGWEYCGNAQASVDAAYQIIVACDVTAEANDKQQAEPMAQLTVASLGACQHRDAHGRRWRCGKKLRQSSDSGYYSAAAATAVERLGFKPYMATARQQTPCPGRRPSVLALLPPLKSAWRRKCGHRKGGHCTRDAKSSWNRCLAGIQRRTRIPSILAARPGQHAW